jgi:hypothetical protein
MSIYRVYAGANGESHIEEVHLAQHPELGALMHVAQVGSTSFPRCGPRTSTRCQNDDSLSTCREKWRSA